MFQFASFSDQQYVVPPPQSSTSAAQQTPSTVGDDGDGEDGANDEENRGRKRKRVSEIVTAGGHGTKKVDADAILGNTSIEANQRPFS